MNSYTQSIDFTELAADIKAWGKLLGFQQVAIADCDLEQASQKLQVWLAHKFHGEMAYMARNTDKRAHPHKLVPGTIRIITARLNYLPSDTQPLNLLKNKQKAYISRYALGRDYHKLIRKRLTKLAQKINQVIGDFNYRAFADSAPVFEKPLAEKSGLGWMGKNTLILNKKAGSWFFLGTLYTDLPLPIDSPVANHCGSCRACIDVCPTKAIIAPYQLNAKRCISYLTIENRGSIPLELRPLIGNRIFGCDDCQLICPWNKFAKFTDENDFLPRHQLNDRSLLELFNWNEPEFLKKTEGSAIRRTGYLGWLRNIAVALGNSQMTNEVVAALDAKKNHSSDLVVEHVIWALKQLQNTTESER